MDKDRIEQYYYFNRSQHQTRQHMNLPLLEVCVNGEWKIYTNVSSSPVIDMKNIILVVSGKGLQTRRNGAEEEK